MFLPILTASNRALLVRARHGQWLGLLWCHSLLILIGGVLPH